MPAGKELMQHYCEHCKKFVEARRAPFSSFLICSICGSEFGADYLAAGTIVSGFRIEEELGRGSFGVVYKALQMNLERMVALKVLSDELARDSEFVDNFFREARLAASLSHPNIVQAFDAGATPEGIYYFAMELIEGETLESRIHRVGRMEATEAVPVALKIARALDYAWERQKLTHGDIKPENIILNSSGEAKLADLGLAKTAHEERTGHLMVTPLYAPPEIVSGMDGFDPVKADIYSFGGTFYHMLAGVPPFNEDDPDRVMEMHLNQIPESLGARFKINSDISFITDRMLAKNQDERPQSWREIVEFLDAIDLELPMMSKSTRRAPITPRPSGALKNKKGLVYIICALAAVIVMLISLVWGLSSGRDKSGGKLAVDSKTNPSKDYEWNKLKADIKFLSEKKALELVSAYINRKDKSTIPPDAVKTLNSLKMENEKAESRKRMTMAFDQELVTLKKELSGNDLKELPPSKLISLQERIVNLFKEVSEHKYLYNRIAGRDKTFLGDKVKELKEAILNNKSRSNSSIINKSRKEQLAKIKQELRKQRISNDEIDRFIASAAEFVKVTGRKRNVKYFSRCFAGISRKDLPVEYSNLYDFIRDSYRRDASIGTVYYENREFFIGTIPFLKGSFSGYKVIDVDKSTIYLEKKLDYGVLKKRIKISRLKSKTRLELLFRAVAADDHFSTLKPDACNRMLLEFLNQNDYEHFSSLLNKMAASETQKYWKMTANIFMTCSREAEAAEFWRDAVGYDSSGKYFDANRCIDNIRKNYSDTAFFKRRGKEINLLAEVLARISPRLKAERGIKRFQRAMAKNKHNTAFQVAVVNWGRYGQLKILAADSIVGELISEKNKVQSWLHGNKPQKRDGIPFMAWEYYPIGGAWNLSQLFKNTKKLPEPVERSLKLLAGIDAGLWDNAEEYVLACEDLKGIVDFFVRSGRKDVAAAVTFCYGVAAIRYGDTALKEKSESALEQLASRGDPSIKILHLELLMKLRMWNKAITFADKYNSSKSKRKDNTPNADFRLAAVELLCILQDPVVDSIRFSQRLKRCRSRFSSNDFLVNDLKWLTVAEHILLGKFTYSDLEVLKQSRGRNIDVCSRIVSDAVLAGVMPDSAIEQFIQLNNKHITGNVASGSLWWKNSLMKLAISRNVDEFRQRLEEVSNEMKVCSVAYYPYVLMMENGLENILRDIPMKRVPAVYERFCNFCPVFSVSEIEVSQRLKNEGSKYISSLFHDLRYPQAFWCGIYALMMNYYDYGGWNNIYNEIKTNKKVLSREERFLLNRLNKIMAR